MTKYSLAALVCLSALYSQHVIAFAPSFAKTSSAPNRISTELHSAKKAAGICTSFLAGVGAAAQIAIADPNIAVSDYRTYETNNRIIQETPSLTSSTSSSVLLSAFGAPTGIGGASFETLDFSLPSYGEVTGSSDPSPSPSPSKPIDIPELKSIAPKFEIKEEKKEEPKPEIKPAPKPVPAPKPAPAPPAPKVKVDEDEPAVTLPSIELPKFSFDAPKVSAPIIKEEKKEEPKAEIKPAPKPAPAPVPAPTPPAPKVKVDKDEPAVTLPSIDLPKFSFDAPKFSAPSIDLPDAPKFSAPSIDVVPKPPAVVADEVNIEPQEVRDERAREAKATFVGLDNSAKDLEKQAKAARAEANAAKKEAGKAKDEACKTRFGGKLLCVRPFGIGY